MALRGNLKDFSLPDVFQLVTLSGKTGVLRIKRADAEGSVWFRDGEVFFAQSDWHAEPLGTRLVAAGRITPSALGRALEIQKDEPSGARRLGAILIAEGYITDKVLEAFVQEQIQDTIFDLFRWDEGDFDFEPLETAPAEDIGLSVSIENIVMEGSRRLEEWNRIKKKIPSMEIVFKMATAPGEGTFDISLKPTEWNLLLKVDGTRSVAELARELGRTDFEVARVIYGLFSAGLLEVASDDEVVRLRAERLEWEAKFAKESEKARESEDRRKLEVLEREAELVAETRERERAGRKTAEDAAAAEAVAAEEEAATAARAAAEAAADHVVEEPAFLTAETPTADDMAVFEQMIGAVLDVPVAQEAPVEAQAPEAEPAGTGLEETGEQAAEPAPALLGEPEPAVPAEEHEELPEPLAPAEAPLDLMEGLPPEIPVERPAIASHPVYEVIEEPGAHFEEAEPEAYFEPQPAELLPLEAFEPQPFEKVAAAEEPAVSLEPVEDSFAADEPFFEDVAADLAALESVPLTAPDQSPAAVAADTLPGAETVTVPLVSDAEMFGGTDEAPVEGAQDLTDLLEALGQPAAEVPAAAPEQAEEKPAITGDYAADLMALGLGELPTIEPELEVAPVEEPLTESLAEAPSPETAAAADLTELLTSLSDEETPVVLDTSSVLGEEEEVSQVAEEPGSGVISTDAFLADFDTSDVSFSSGLLGDELTALTGGGPAPKRPQATAKKLPDEGEHVLRRDKHVDRALVEKIIEGVQKL